MKEIPTIEDIKKKFLGLEDRKGYGDSITDDLAEQCAEVAASLCNSGGWKFVKQYQEAMDKIYNENDLSREAVIKHFGIHHKILPEEVDKILSDETLPCNCGEKDKEIAGLKKEKELLRQRISEIVYLSEQKGGYHP